MAYLLPCSLIMFNGIGLNALFAPASDFPALEELRMRIREREGALEEGPFQAWSMIEGIGFRRSVRALQHVAGLQLDLVAMMYAEEYERASKLKEEIGRITFEDGLPVRAYALSLFSYLEEKKMPGWMACLEAYEKTLALN